MTTAVFFVGEGEGARFIGGQHSDGYIQENGQKEGIPIPLLLSTTEEEFRRHVGHHMRRLSENERWKISLSWTAAKEKEVEYIYCFFEGHVWITTGGRWFNPCIPANIKPSKAAPSPPVCRVGKFCVKIALECGQCCIREALDHEKFDAQHIPGEWSVNDILAYFTSRGWQVSETQGWLCINCAE